MALHGIVDIRQDINSTNSTWYNDTYVSLIKFLRGSAAQSIGIQQIAYNTGSNSTGEGYSNEARPVGNNAWSCFRFLSASMPFYMLVQTTNSNSMGTAPGNPGALEGSTSLAGLGFAFALRSDGGNPWNGTSNNNGNDVKGFPVWTSGSAQLYVWPRHNSIGGVMSNNREGLLACPIARSVPNGPSFNARFHFICDEDHVGAVGDESNDGSVTNLFFGKYVARSGSTNICPYVCLRNSSEGTLALTTYGPISGSTNVAEGGIAHPSNFASGTKTVQISTYDDFIVQAFQPSMLMNRDFPVYDEWPIFVGASEASAGGLLGHVDWIKYIYGPAPFTTSPDGNRLYIGTTTAQSMKLSIPFSSAVTLGTYTRSGNVF